MLVGCTLGGPLMDLSKAFGITDVAEMTDRVGDRQSRKEIRVLMLTMFYFTISSLNITVSHVNI